MDSVASLEKRLNDCDACELYINFEQGLKIIKRCFPHEALIELNCKTLVACWSCILMWVAVKVQAASNLSQSLLLSSTML